MNGTVVPDRASARVNDWRFFTGMAAAAALVIFVGFAPTYYLKGLFGTRALSSLLHLHGALFSLWIALFVTQAALVAARRTDIHRRLGVAGGVLLAVMWVVGVATAIDGARRGIAPAGGPSPLAFLVIPLGDMVVFPLVAGTGIYFRRRSDIHKRLMTIATISILTPGLARIPFLAAGGLPAFYGLTFAFIGACWIYDWLTRRRVHPAFLWGGLFVIASVPARIALAGTDAWLAFAAWLIA